MANHKTQQLVYHWPPTFADLKRYTVPVAPCPEEFPDDGGTIPGYANLAGRTVRPAWLDCMCGCGARFLSPDRSHVRFADDCRVKINAAA